MAWRQLVRRSTSRVSAVSDCQNVVDAAVKPMCKLLHAKQAHAAIARDARCSLDAGNVVGVPKSKLTKQSVTR